MRNVDLFDDYLSGRLEGDARAEFESRLKSDSEFSAEFSMHRLFAESLAHTALKQEILPVLEEAHAEEFGKANIVAIDHSPKTGMMRVASIAASVSLVIFLSGYLMVRNSISHSRTSEVNARKKIIEGIDNFVKAYSNTTKEKKQYAPATFEATGFAISTKGYLLTSLHTVKNADSVMVLNDQLEYVPAERVWEDPKLDVAIFKLKNTEGLNIGELPISFRRDDVDLGEKIFALGYPRETVVYSEGNVSANSGNLGDTSKYQLSMLINPGNSGSPVLDEQGNLVGIISSYNDNAQGVSYAVKAQYVYDMIKTIPDEKLRKEITLNGKNSMRKLKRTEQIKRLKPFVFNIKVYNSKAE